MKTSIASAYFWYAKNADEKFARMKELGYEAVDESLEETESHYYKSYEAMENYCQTIRAAADKYGLEISQVHASYGVWYPKDTREEIIDGIVGVMKMGIYGASILGAKNYVIHPITRIGFWNNGYNLLVDDVKSYTADVMKKLLPACEEYGVYLCLENLTDYNVPFVLDIVKEVASPYAQICLDTGHASVMRVDMGDIVRSCGKLLRCLHIHDTNGYYDLHLPPFMGVINWDSFIDALAEIGYSGTMNLESEINRGATMPDEFIDMLEIYSAKASKYLSDRVESKR